jgi:hypothetical protein
MMIAPRSLPWALAAALLAAAPTRALDGFGVVAPPDDLTASSTSLSGDAASYYEQVLAASSPEDAVSSRSAPAGLPPSLYVVEAAGRVEYARTGGGAWQVRVEVAERPHERVDAVYDLVLALPLPTGFRSRQWRIPVREGARGASVPVVYAGEAVGLKRNAALEASWLPLLVAAPDGLPDLTGSGYAWTLWDTIVRYDATAGSTVQGFGRLDYEVDASVAAPDPGDPRNAAYVITWVPTLDAAVPPFALRLDVVEPGEE